TIGATTSFRRPSPSESAQRRRCEVGRWPIRRKDHSASGEPGGVAHHRVPPSVLFSRANSVARATPRDGYPGRKSGARLMFLVVLVVIAWAVQPGLSYH